MSLRSVSGLPDDYELVILSDGTQMLREQQTKAQARIQALRVKSRNDKLRKTLISLSNQVDKHAKRKLQKELAQKDQTEVNHQLKEQQTKLHVNDNVSNANYIETDCLVDNSAQMMNINEASAIQKQMISKSEIKIDKNELTSLKEMHQSKTSKFKPLNLKKLIFEKLANK